MNIIFLFSDWFQQRWMKIMSINVWRTILTYSKPRTCPSKNARPNFKHLHSHAFQLFSYRGNVYFWNTSLLDIKGIFLTNHNWRCSWTFSFKGLNEAVGKKNTFFQRITLLRWMVEPSTVWSATWRLFETTDNLHGSS